MFDTQLPRLSLCYAGCGLIATSAYRA